MKKLIYILFLTAGIHSISVNGQETDSLKSWELNADGYFYFLPDDFMFLPVFKADKDKLHIEARYNYENQNTFSGWVGYNINGGDKISYTLTPMIGGVVGNTNGIAPGLEATIGLGRFEFYTEAEYLFDFEVKSDSYFYNWADLTFLVNDWLWIGLSGQRLRSYYSELDYQRGLLIGGGGERWEVNGYFFNFDTDNPFYVGGITFSF